MLNFKNPMLERRKYIKFNFPMIAGVPITYWGGDKAKIRDGKEGMGDV